MTSDSKQVIERAIGSSNISEDVSSYAIDGLHPKVVALPNTIDELGKVMSAANDESLAVAPWGAGTRTSVGNRLEKLDVIVDLSRLNRVVQHTPADLTATFEAGISFSDAQKTLGEHGQFLAIDPPLPDRSTIGGALASGASGPLKWQFGHPRDTVIGMKVVQADGKIVKSGGQVVKNVSGYDMARLHVGSIGTLGIIAEVSFKLTPKPRNEATLVAAFDSIWACSNAGMAIFGSHVLPLALTTVSDEANARSGSNLSGGKYFLAILLGGRPRTVERQVNECRAICSENDTVNVELLESGQADSLWRKIADFGWSESTTPVMSGRISVLPSKVAGVISTLGQTDSDVRPAIAAHPAYGSVMVNWFGDDSDGLADTLNHAIKTVHREEGRIIIERCPTEIKDNLDVWDELGEPLEIMRRMKVQYDSKRILNPGRFAGRI